MMKLLSKILLLFCIVALYSSCDKEPERPDYYFRYKINGVQKDFKANTDSGILFLDDPESINKFAFFTMTTGDDNEKNSIFMSLRYQESLEPGFTYIMQEPVVVNDQVVARISTVYFDENGIEHGAVLLRSNHPGAEDNATVTLTSLVEEGSYGTFTAVVFPSDATGDLADRTPIRITDGEYFLPNFRSLR